MTRPVATPASAGTTDLREAIAAILCDCLRYDRERGLIIGISDATDALLARPIATLRERAEAAEARATATESRLATLAAENEALRAALKSIADKEPATAEMTLAHEMAQEARAALARGGSDV